MVKEIIAKSEFDALIASGAAVMVDFTATWYNLILIIIL
jgi:hypothetical protein